MSRGGGERLRVEVDWREARGREGRERKGASREAGRTDGRSALAHLPRALPKNPSARPLERQLSRKSAPRDLCQPGARSRGEGEGKGGRTLALLGRLRPDRDPRRRRRRAAVWRPIHRAPSRRSARRRVRLAGRRRWCWRRWWGRLGERLREEQLRRVERALDRLDPSGRRRSSIQARQSTSQPGRRHVEPAQGWAEGGTHVLGVVVPALARAKDLLLGELIERRCERVGGGC